MSLDSFYKDVNGMKRNKEKKGEKKGNKKEKKRKKERKKGEEEEEEDVNGMNRRMHGMNCV